MTTILSLTGFHPSSKFFWRVETSRRVLKGQLVWYQLWLKDYCPVRWRTGKTRGKWVFPAAPPGGQLIQIRLAWVELKHLPFSPRLHPGLLKQKRSYQSWGWINTSHAEIRSQETVTGGKVKNTPGFDALSRSSRPRAPPAEPALSQWELELRGWWDAGPRLGQSGSKSCQGEEMGGEAGGDGDRATSTEVSHLGMRGTLPHLLHTSNCVQEEGPKLLSPPPHTAPCKPEGGCWESLSLLAAFLCCLQGERRRGTTWCWELTSGLAGFWEGRAEEEWLGLGDSMRGPWTERRSWDCPAFARCGQPCSRCSHAEPKETGCEYGGSRGSWGVWQKGCPTSGNFQLRRGRRGGDPREGDLIFRKTSGIGEESRGAA